MTKAAQNWLDAKYPDKTIGGKIELYDKNVEGVEELTGNLLIENYVNVEEIDLEHRDKRKGFSLSDRLKGKIGKITVKNCPKVKELNLNNNEIKEIIFEGDFLDLDRLDAADNELTKIDISKVLNLTWLNITRNPLLTEVRGLEYSTKLKHVNLYDTLGFNGQDYRKWKDAIKGILNIPPTDPLTNTWENDLKTKLDGLEERPTQEQLDEAVKNKGKEFENHIDPDDKAKLEKTAKDKLGMVSKTDHETLKNQLDARPNITKKEWDDYSQRPKQTELDRVQAESDKNKIDLGQANQKVQDYENGLKNKLGLDDSALPNWKGEIDKLKNRPTSDNSEQIKNILGLKPNETLPSDWNTKLISKTKFDGVEDELKKWSKLGNTPEEAEQKLKNPVGTGTGAALTPQQKEKLDKYDKLRKWADEQEKVIDWAKDILGDAGAMNEELQTYILDVSKLKV